RFGIERSDDVARLRQDAQRALHLTLTSRRVQPVREVRVRAVLRERVNARSRRPRGRLHAWTARLRLVLEPAEVLAHLVASLADALDLRPEPLPLRLGHPLAPDALAATMFCIFASPPVVEGARFGSGAAASCGLFDAVP